MSQAAEAWLADPDRKYGAGPGTPALCVKYVACGYCGAAAGELCRGRFGPTIGHHIRRGSAYASAHRCGDVPSPAQHVATVETEPDDETTCALCGTDYAMDPGEEPTKYCDACAHARVAELEALLNTPVVDDFLAAVKLEAAHQVERWGAAHDAGKAPLDWFWLLGFLGQKAATSAIAGDVEKAKHHTISSAAMLLNWHARLSGSDRGMRPGIEDPSHG